MAADVYAGLAVTSHRDGTLAKAVFSNVSFGPVGTTQPPTNSPPVISGTPPTGASVGVAIRIHADRDGSQRQHADVQHLESAELGYVQQQHWPAFGYADER